MTTMTQENTAVSEAHALIGREALSQLRQQGKGALAAEAALANYPYSGHATVSILGLGVGKVQVTANFNTGDKLEYNAWIYGPIAGAGGISFGGGALDLSPADLIGKSISCALTVGVAGVFILFFLDGKVIGTFTGGGPNVGVGSAGGTGEWKRV